MKTNSSQKKQLNSKLFILSTLLLAFYCCNTRAQTHEYRFDNGLKLLVKEDHRSPVVVSQIWYKVGSSYEHDGITGISHALEHMMFKGTEKYPAGEFSRIISANGGQDNAFTGADYTAYFQTLEKSRLAISFELEADRMRNLIMPEEEFKKEIKVVREERRWRTEDRPQAYTYEVAMATAYQTSPYRQPIIGWMADLESMKVDMLKDWYRHWYVPNNATVVVVGDVEAEQVYSLARKYFANLPRGTIPVLPKRIEVSQLGIKQVTVKRTAELPYLLMAYKVPVLKTAIDQSEEIDEWEPYALEVLAGILDGGNSARFSSNLIRGSESATSVSVNYNLIARLNSLFIISGVPSKNKTVQELEQSIRSELHDLQINKVSMKELQRVKAQVISGDVYKRDSIFYQAMIIGMLETVGLSWQLESEYVERIKAITAEQVRIVAKKYFNEDSLTVAMLLPQAVNN